MFGLKWVDAQRDARCIQRQIMFSLKCVDDQRDARCIQRHIMFSFFQKSNGIWLSLLNFLLEFIKGFN